MYLSMTICFKISILGKTGDFCRAWDMRKIVPGVTSSYATSVFKLYLPIAKGRRERERERKACSTGQWANSLFLGSLALAKSLLQARLTAKLCHEKSSPGSLKSCCPLECSLHQNVGQGNECSPTLSLAPFIGQQTGAQRDETTGPRSHHGLVAKQRIK